jgi:threonine/homoserine/homoserine lactone efflux protein
MSRDTLFAFSLFALVTSITPGPNNIMLLASGVNFGFRSSVPHMLGISSGFFLMVVAVGFGLAEVFTQLPWVYGILKWVGAIYLLYLAWCIAMSGPLDDKNSTGRLAKPMNFGVLPPSSGSIRRHGSWLWVRSPRTYRCRAA